jgi:hypothetical protein
MPKIESLSSQTIVLVFTLKLAESQVIGEIKMLVFQSECC